MAFHEIRFPANVSFGSQGGPERLTEIVTLANGFEERNTPWEHSRRRYDAGFGLRSLEDVDALLAFFEARRARLHAFRWKDWSDFKSCGGNQAIAATDQLIGVGDGVTTAFALKKAYLSGTASYIRPIAKPVAGTVIVAIANDPKVEGLEFSVDAATGIVSFTTPPDIGALITAGYEFDVPVRFDADVIQTSVASFRAGDVPNVPIVEVRI
ncbi:phage distal tail protein, Rcc01695 family [Cypionkella sinensis]|uniref:TIGR02217 family protein n=1 Tax=Cypionkella sinensis TaxID=1756043 RepID=A0ABV7IYA2_9RHOB